MEWFDANDTKKEATAMAGVRRSESQHRSDAEEHVLESERHGCRELWQPLVWHTDEIRDALFPRAEFEDLPHRSIKCYPCINANIDDVRLLSEDRIQLIDIEQIALQANVTEFEALVKALAYGQTPITVLLVNWEVLDAMVAEQGSTFSMAGVTLAKTAA